MGSIRTARVLVVANRTAATPRLLAEVRRRARAGPSEFTQLIPDAKNRVSADWTLDTAVPLLRRAAGKPVANCVGGPDAWQAVQDAVRSGDFDEIIVSTLSRRHSQWLRRDLVRRIDGLGLPVTAVIGDDVPRVRPRDAPHKSVDQNAADLMGAWKIMLPRDVRRRDERRAR